MTDTRDPVVLAFRAVLANPEAAVDDLAALVVRQLLVPRCHSCEVTFTTEEVVRVLGRGQPCVACGERAPPEPLRSPQSFEVGPDGWPRVKGRR
jgi:hypothetical protein